MQKLNILVFILISLLFYTGYSLVTAPTPFQIEVGCFDSSDCAGSQCRKGCVDCISNTHCTSCMYGWFLFHTPENTVECVECPYYDVFGKSPGQYDNTEVHRCASCLEMPLQWEKVRRCNFRYEFMDSGSGFSYNTPLNVTMSKPELFTINVDNSVQQSNDETRYSTKQMTDHCDTYPWKNYNIDTLITQDEIQEILDNYNTVVCSTCQSGYLIKDDLTCESCLIHINNCSACYRNPESNEVACSICDTGFGPNSEQTACEECSVSIENCSDCNFNTNTDTMECGTCKDGFRPKEDGTACEEYNCDDPNCLLCPEDDFVCEKCADRFTVKDDECTLSFECRFGTDDCNACHVAVNIAIQAEFGNTDLKCLFCEGVMGTYECLELCLSGYGYNPNTSQCEQCEQDNCNSCEFGPGNPPQQTCLNCMTGFGFNDQSMECQECDDGCSECEFMGGVHTCYMCDTANGYGYVDNQSGGNPYCKKCDDFAGEDPQCSECTMSTMDNVNFDFFCVACKSTAYKIGPGDRCELDCDQFFDGLCTPNECLGNPYYGKYTLEETIYPSQPNLCLVCEPGTSMSGTGNTCNQNVFNCENSLKLSTATYQTLNPFVDTMYVSENNLGICYNGCRIDDGTAKPGDKEFFQDPWLQKCVLCDSTNPRCRKKVTVSRYIYCDPSLATKPFSSMPDEDWVSYENINDDFFNFEIGVNDWNNEGVSMFDFNIIFVGGTTKQTQQCDIPNFFFNFQTNIPERVFRVQELKLSIKTWQMKSTVQDDQINIDNKDTFGEINLNFYSYLYEITISGFQEFSMQNINFYGGIKLDGNEIREMKESGQYEIESIQFLFESENMMPNHKVTLKNISFNHQLNTFLIPQFLFQDIGTLTIDTFTFASQSTSTGSLTGFQMFKFQKYRSPIQKFNLFITDFTLSDMLFKDTILFEIPQKEAQIKIENVKLSNVVFKNAMFLGDTSSGLGKGEQWLTVVDVNLSNSQFYDSAMVYVTNAMYFLAQRWTVKNIHNALAENDKQALIIANTFLIDDITLQSIVCYGSSLVEHRASPSVVDYYSTKNELAKATIQDITVYLKPNESLFAVRGFNDISLKDFVLDNIKVPTENTKLDSNVIIGVHDEDLSVYFVQSYNVIALTSVSSPEYIFTIRNDVVQNSAVFENFQAFDLGDGMNMMEIQNVNKVEIAAFSCGSKDKADEFAANCFKAYTTGSVAMDTLFINDGQISHIKSETTPVEISGYSNIQLVSLNIFGLHQGYGFHLQPYSDNGQVLVQECNFHDIETVLHEDELVHAGALYIDLSQSTSSTVEISKCDFHSIFAKFRGAGVYFKNTNNPAAITISDTQFRQVLSVKGGVIHANLADSSKSSISLNNVSIEGPGSEDSFTFTQTLGVENGAESKTMKGYEQLFEWIKQSGRDEAEYQEDPAVDSFVANAFQAPCAIYINTATVNIDTLSLSNIHLQQGFLIENSILTATKITADNISCINCGNYNGANNLYNVDFTISNSTFSNNKAYIGGGLYVADSGACDNIGGSYCAISDTIFTNNWASTLAGGLYIKDTLFNLTSNQFISNQAAGNYEDENNPVKGQAGGIFTEIASTTGSSSSSRILQTFTNLLTDCTFTQNTAEYAAAGRITGGISTTISGETLSANKATLYGDGLLDTCIYGEGKTSDGKCQTCPVNQYSLDKEGKTCSACMNHANCLGGDRIIVHEKYWRPNNYSDQVIHCKNNEANCLEMPLAQNNFTCRTGYLGGLCEACDLYGIHTGGERYSVVTAYNCGTCNDKTANALRVVAMNIWIMISMLIAVKGTIKLVQEKIMLRSIMLLFKGFRPKYDETGILIKMFMNYGQIIFILSTLDISLPSALTTSQDVVGNPVKSMGNALDCYLVELQSDIPNIYFKIIWQLVMNILQFGLFVLCFGIARFLKKTRVTFHHLLWTTLIYLLIYLQPSYVNSILETISCRNLGGYKYILADVQFMCYTSEYYFWTLLFLVPFLIFWVIILPGIMWLVLYRHRRNDTLQLSETLYCYGFLYQEYRNRVFYWELVKVFQKTLIVAVIQLYSNDIKEKAVLVFEIVFLYGILSYFKHPYDSKHLNKLDLIITIVCCFSLITGVFIYKMPSQYPYWEWIGLAGIFIANIWFVLYMLYLITERSLKDIQGKHIDKIQKAKEKAKVLKKIFKDSPESLALRKKRWGIIRKAVFLFIDGKAAGIVKSLQLPIPRDLLQNSEEMLNELKLEKLESVDIQNDFNFGMKKSSQNKGVYDSSDLRTPQLGRKLSSKKSVVIPDLYKNHTKMLQSQNMQKANRYTSLQILSGELSKEQYEDLLATVNEFRRVRDKEYKDDKERFRKYFIEECGIAPHRDSRRTSLQSEELGNIKIAQVVPGEIPEEDAQEGSDKLAESETKSVHEAFGGPILLEKKDDKLSPLKNNNNNVKSQRRQSRQPNKEEEDEIEHLNDKKSDQQLIDQHEPNSATSLPKKQKRRQQDTNTPKHSNFPDFSKNNNNKNGDESNRKRRQTGDKFNGLNYENPQDSNTPRNIIGSGRDLVDNSHQVVQNTDDNMSVNSDTHMKKHKRNRSNIPGKQSKFNIDSKHDSQGSHNGFDAHFQMMEDVNFKSPQSEEDQNI